MIGRKRICLIWEKEKGGGEGRHGEEEELGQEEADAATDDAIRLRLFPFTLIEEAKAWLRSLDPNSITTWDQMRNQFVSRFFLPAKADKLKVEIRTFQQKGEEMIVEFSESFKRMMYLCPIHGLSKSKQVQTFYRGLNYPT
ncbi:hypothetical protein OSB04_023721 [Centaurea solstitialis]|uniref:Retrotransposon gag domain-containing protein n=1 Tax=Centaurea solstitialis TaxID=347529 RepID=A0AA38SLG1_9ASTR|nr:hypothetical protein OSB04_023721 [Centaurea solstitialis]